MIIKRGLLDWSLPFWTLPPGREKREKKQVVYKELTRKELGPTQLKANFICRKSQNAGELREIAAISSIKFRVNFFSVGLDNTVRICDKM